MKKAGLNVVGVVVAILLATSSAWGTPIYQAKNFTLISTERSVSGWISASWVEDDGGTGKVEENYNKTSPMAPIASLAPIRGAVDNMGIFANSKATPTSVYAATSTGYFELTDRDSYKDAYAVASVSTLFQPNFSGSGPAIRFSGGSELMHGSTTASIYDVTSDVSLWYGTWEEPHWGWEETQFNYSEWQQDHIYRLFLAAGAFNDDCACDDGFGYVSAYIPFSNVPEPTTMLLLGLGLVGLAGIKRRMS